MNRVLISGAVGHGIRRCPSLAGTRSLRTAKKGKEESTSTSSPSSPLSETSTSTASTSTGTPSRPKSIVPEGTHLKGTSYLAGKGDALALKDEEYPDWLWDLISDKTKVPKAYNSNKPPGDLTDRHYQLKQQRKADIHAANFRRAKK